MTDTQPFALVVAVVAMVGLVALLSNRVSERVKVPSPALVLVGAAVIVNLVPGVHRPAEVVVERVVTVALVCVLFDGGMRIGWSRFRSALAPITSIGLLGTLLTAAAGGALAHVALGLGWYGSLLVATAVAPTDPAVMFSVLGKREVAGRAGTILEGESGANDPVGIALMASLITAGHLSWGALGHVSSEFALQMSVGAAVGVAGARGLLWSMRRLALPTEGLYPLRTLAGALLLYGVTTLAHGSGFLAVFAAGIALGDERAPYKREIERFHKALAGMGEIVAFVVLGLTVDVGELSRADVWIPGLVLGLVLAVVIRPVLVGVCLLPARLARNERRFVLFAGLKGAVPILLGGYLLAAHVAGAPRLYAIVITVVLLSVVVQGALVPAAAHLLRLPMQVVEPEPWALGVRLRDEPDNVHRLTVRSGSAADGRTVADLGTLPGDAWVTLLVRDGRVLAVRGGTRLQAGDAVTVLADLDSLGPLTATFEQPEAG